MLSADAASIALCAASYWRIGRPAQLERESNGREAGTCLSLQLDESTNGELSRATATCDEIVPCGSRFRK